MPAVPPWLVTVLLLVASNVFMTFAWYYHVKQKAWPLLVAILVSWMLALPEYLLQVPANRVGHVDRGGPFSLPQLKVVQEAITLSVFVCFTVLVAREPPRARDLVAFALVLLAVWVAVGGRR
ncbi:MAG: DMT family protein [Planctomycetota bacterium]